MKNFFALFIFAGGFVGWYLYHEKKEAIEGLHQAKQQLGDFEKSITERRSEFQLYSRVATLKKQINSKQVELKSLNDKLQSLGDQTSALLSEQAQLRSIIRQKHVGKTIILTLNSGRNLGSVRILKIDDSGVSVANATGIIKVQPSELPPDLKQLMLY